jgi:hypothetical protein
MKLPNKNCRQRRQQRGAAMVEAVIVIPVLLLLWVSLYYLADQFASRQAAAMTARSCAWLYSANNCQEVPPGCGGFLHESSGSAEVSPEVKNALEDGAREALQGGDAKGIVGAVVGDLVAGPLMAAFTSSVDATVSKDVQQPATFGGGLKRVTGRYHLACNLEPTSPEQMAQDAWSSLVE